MMQQSGRFNNWKRNSRAPQRKSLTLETLEVRDVPATYSVSGTTLTIDLDTASESITFNANAATVSVTGSATANDGGNLATFVTLNGNNATISPTVTSINITDSANNGSVFFVDSGVNTYSQDFNITLNNGATNRLEFSAGTSTFTEDFTATAAIIAAGTLDQRVNLTGATTDITLTGTQSVTLPNQLVVGGNLSVASAGPITQTSIAGTSPGIQVAGNAAFQITSGNRSITLPSAGNKVTGTVDFTQNGGTISSINWTNAASAAQTPSFGLLANLTNLTLNHSNSNINIGATTVAGPITLSAFGDITQSAAIISNSGTSAFTVTGNSKILLDNTSNNFNNIQLNSLQSTQTHTIVDANGIGVATSNIGRAGLNLTAVLGGITQAGGLVQLPSSGPLTLTTSAASSSVNLSNTGNFFGGTVTIAGVPTTVSLRDNSPLASTANLTLPTTVTDLTLRYNLSPVVLGAFIPANVTTLTATGVGIYQKDPLIIPNVDVNGLTGPIILDKPTNNFNVLKLSNSSTGYYDVTVVNSDGLVLGPTAMTVGNARLSITATSGNITQSGTITTGSNSLASFNAPAGAVTLNGNNSFGGRLEVASGTNSIDVKNTQNLILGNITTTGGLATFLTTSGTITQSPGTKLTIGATSSFTSTSGTTLTNPGNTFTGSVILASGGSASTITADGPLALGNVTANSVNVTATGAITQTGTITASGSSTFTSTGGAITLTGANNFGTIAFNATGTNAVSIIDTNALNLGESGLGTGALSITTAGNLTQTGGLRTSSTSTAGISLNAGANQINFASTGNDFSGPLNISGGATLLTAYNRGNIDLSSTVPVFTSTANLTLTAGKKITFPNSSLSVQSIIATASVIQYQNNVSTTGTFSNSGATSFTGAATTFAASAVSFSGDVSATSSLSFSATGGVTQSNGTWNLGATNTTLTNTSGGLTLGLGSRFVTSGNTTLNLAASGLTVNTGATLQVGTDPTLGETLTINSTGNLNLNGALQVGFGSAISDGIIKSTGANVVLGSTSTLIGTGLAVGTKPVISVSGGVQVTGAFNGSLSPLTGLPIDFKAGSDIVKAAYTPSTEVTVTPGGVESLTGTVSGVLQNGDAYTVSTSLGAAGKLVVLEKTNNVGADLGLDIVVRNNSANSTLSITPTPAGNNGTGNVLLHEVAVNGTGGVTINAPLANLTNGAITTAGPLTALTIRNITSSTIKAGGSTASATALTGKVLNGASITVGGILSAITAQEVLLSSFTAEKFGTIKITGLPLQGIPQGDFDAQLISRTTTLGSTLTSATIAGTLSGTWDLFGNIGTVKALSTNNWDLGTDLTNGGNAARNPDGIANVTSLDLGRTGNATPVNVAVTGKINAIVATDWLTGSLRAGSLGTITTKTDLVTGANGNFNVGILTTTETPGTAVGSITVAGNFDLGSNKLVVRTGNIGAIKATKKLSGTIIATNGTNSGAIASLTGGTVTGLNVDARSIGSVNGVANIPAQQFGDITSNSFTVRGNDATAAKNAIGLIKTPRNLSSNSFTLLAGNLPSVSAGYQAGSNTFNLANSTAGRLGSITVGDWSSGTIIAESIGTITTKGALQSPLSSVALLGNLNSFNITAYRESGTATGVGAITVAGNLGQSFGNVISPNGVTSISAGRAATTVTVITDSATAGTDVIGRLGSFTAGSFSNVTVSAESVGPITTKGYATPESASTSRTPGSISSLTVIARGTGIASGLGVGAIISDSDVSNLVVNAPFGVAGVSAKGSLSTVTVIADDLPLIPSLTTVKPTFGRVGAINGYDFTTVLVRSATIGTVKASANFIAGTPGTISSSSSFVARDSAASTGITSITTDGSFDSSTIFAPAGLGTLTVDESISNATVAAGLLSTKSISAIKAGDVSSSTIVANQLASFNVIGNQEPVTALGGGVTSSFINIFGNLKGIGLGTVSALGTIRSTVFDITDGDLTSFTASRLRDSRIQVGGRFTKGNALANGVTFGNTNRTLGTLNLTAPAFSGTPSPADLRDGAGFRDSYVAAAKLGTVKIVNAASTLNTTTEVQGVVFRNIAPTPTSGTVTVGGVAVVDNAVPNPTSKFAKVGVA